MDKTYKFRSVKSVQTVRMRGPEAGKTDED